MSKVGVLTFHWADNFGAVLQAYALQRAIESIGFAVEIVDFRPPQLILPYLPVLRWREIVERYGEKKAILGFAKEVLTYRRKKSRQLLFESFREQYLHLGDQTFFVATMLANTLRGYSHCVVGSDQVWRPCFLRGAENVYFLPFREIKRKVAYAASIGEPVPQGLFEFYKMHLSAFDHISVREGAAGDFLSSLLGRAIEVVLDPTLLLSAKDYEEIMCVPKEKLPERYLLAYNFDVQALRLAEELAKRYKLPVVSYSKPFRRRVWSLGKAFDHLGPREFLWLTKHAEVVVTNSYHGMIFAMLFEKPLFIVISPKFAPTRILDFLSRLNLNQNLSEKNGVLLATIDVLGYEKLWQKLSYEREKSYAFLYRALGA